jgi:integrase
METITPHLNENTLLASPDNHPIVNFCAPQDISSLINSDPIYGIDTIKVAYRIRPEEIDFEGWKKCEWSAVQREGEFLIHFYYLRHEKTANGTVITLKYVPKDYKRRPLHLLFIEFSLPKLIFGHNYKNISDWEFSLDFANATLNNIPGLPSLGDIRDASLHRLDLCANLQVGTSDINDFLQILSKCKHPHRTGESFNGTGMVFPSKEIRTTFYNKYEQCKKSEAKGNLRMEIQMLSRRAIGEWIGAKYPILRQITHKMIVERLHKELRILHMDHPAACDVLEITRLLSEKYSICRAQSLLGYWLRKRTSTRDQMLSSGYTNRKICYYESFFKKAGISSNSMDSKKAFPALSQFLPEIDKIGNKPLSDTRENDNTKKTEAQMSTRRSKGEGSIFRRKDGLWVAQITIQGRQIGKYAKSQAECREWLKTTKAQIEGGLTLAGAQVSLADFLKEWLTLIETSVRAKTSDQYRQIVRQHIVPDLGPIRLKDLNPRQIQSLYSKKLETGTSPRSVIMIHAVLRRALNHALKLGVIGRNPVMAVIRPKFKRKEMNVLSDSQVRVLLSAAAGTRFEATYWVAVTTGLRLGELLGLKWSDLDWVNRRLRIQRQVQRFRGSLVFSEPKTSAGRRVIALGMATIEILRKHQNLQSGEIRKSGETWKENGMIFPSTIGTPMDPSNLYHHFKNLLKETGLPNIRFHDLRHTAATLMLQQGVHPKIVQERLGHADISMTLSTYSHVLPVMQDEAAEKMDELLMPIDVSGEIKKLGERESLYLPLADGFGMVKDG